MPSRPIGICGLLPYPCGLMSSWAFVLWASVLWAFVRIPFQTDAAADGNVRSPMVARAVRGVTSVDVLDERRRRRALRSETRCSSDQRWDRTLVVYGFGFVRVLVKFVNVRFQFGSGSRKCQVRLSYELQQLAKCTPCYLPNKRSVQISSVHSCILYLRNTSFSMLAAVIVGFGSVRVLFEVVNGGFQFCSVLSKMRVLVRFVRFGFGSNHISNCIFEPSAS